MIKRMIKGMIKSVALMLIFATVSNATLYANAQATDPVDVSSNMEWQFSDVAYKPGNWKYEAVKYVSENGIMNGVGDGTRFDPDAPLTRSMFATMLYRMAGEPSVAYMGKYPDVPAGKWYSNAVIWASKQGIVNGYADGRFGTNDSITREQIAKMLNEYGKMQGYDVSQSADFTNFADAGAVSKWANGYMQWAVGSGMISGKEINGKKYLDPKGNATRAESATMLMRFLEKDLSNENGEVELPEPTPEPQPDLEPQPIPGSGTSGESGGGSGVTVPDHEESGLNLVWVPTQGGKKYHSRSGCSGMENPMQVSIETAEANGYTPCKKCY